MSTTIAREVLAQEEWELRSAAHRARLEKWTIPHLDRRSRGIKHPVEDFLFEYYPFSVSKLLTWHPGIGVTLTGDVSSFTAPTYVTTDDGATVDVGLLHKNRGRLDVAIRILEGTQSRTAQLGCFGLHEWAMVYRLQPDQVRHEQLDLRVTPEAIAATVDKVGLRCTHIDAYRFFTEPAMPLNPVTPTRETQPDLEQPGCLHATMDLYKYAMWFQPFVPAELVADTFEVAMRTRELDMRASPYDLGDDTVYPPVAVETTEGRREYAQEQGRIMEATVPIRAQLLEALRSVQHSYLNSYAS
ncbi:MAG: 3-methyladenine DNA glycosylase [Candidatus Nanopelagicales bacterium]|jgi:hypothetical protein|nr:3-methyladenine DNA glycosylase [Candidatus Nanopelagicales bacterium]